MTTDPIVAAARFLTEQLDWMRHATDEQGQPWAVAAFAEIADCAGRLRGLVNGPSEQRWLGTCGMPTDEPDTPCTGNLYAAPGATTARCRECKTEQPAQTRRDYLSKQVKTYAYTAKEISEATGINVKTIRTWHDRGRLPAHGTDRDGAPLHLLADVKALAIEAEKRRHRGAAA